MNVEEHEEVGIFFFKLSNFLSQFFHFFTLFDTVFPKGGRFRRFFSLAAVAIHKNHVTDKIVNYYKIIVISRD